MTAPVSTRAHLFRPVTDSDGNITPNVKVTVYERGSNQLLQQVIYNSPSGSGTLTNPFTTSSGFIDFYLAQPQDVRIGVAVAVQGGAEQRFEDVPVMPPADQLVRSPSGFQIANAPAPGKYMQASDDRTAYWVSADEVMASRPTPTVLLKQYDFSASYLDDLRPSGTTAYVDVGLDPKPQDYGFLQALSFTGALRVPALNFREHGRVIFAYKVISPSAGAGAAQMRVSIDDHSMWVQTPVTEDFLNEWSIGYFEITQTGSHTVVFDQLPGSDSGSEVLLGPVVIQYGNNIPPHDHTGTGEHSVRLGTSSIASAKRSTALGDGAEAESEDATAAGAGAVANARGTAIGSQTWAASDSLALGYRASGTSAATEWIALGARALAGGDSAVAIGYDAYAGGSDSVGIGAEVTAGGKESVAIGSGASADGYRSLAIGAGALADYDFSMAIGPGVRAQAAHEARLGDDSTVVVMPGSLRHTGPQAVIGGPQTKLAFYGATPVARPTVRGSRNGNAVLTQLLSTLNAMGLICDQSSS